MQGPKSEKSNVISLFGAKEARESHQNQSQEAESQESSQEEGQSGRSVEEMFRDIIERNMRNKDRLQKERSSTNKSVLRSYRIKN